MRSNCGMVTRIRPSSIWSNPSKFSLSLSCALSNLELTSPSSLAFLYSLPPSLPPRHPMEGKTNPIEDVGIRLAHGLHDLHLQENLAPTREAISAAVTSGGESLVSAYSYLSKTVAEGRDRRASWAVGDGAGGPGGQGGQGAEVGATLMAGAEAAKTGAASLAAGVGSFLASRRGLFAGGTPAGGTKVTSPPISRTPSPSTAPGSGTSPLPSPSFGSFLLRPLASNPLATSAPGAYPPTPSAPSSTTTPSPSTASGLASNVGGFFGSIRKSFLDPSPPPAASSSTAQGGRRESVPGLKGLELLEDPLTVPRDLDAEHAAKEERMRKRRTRELERAEARLEGRL